MVEVLQFVFSSFWVWAGCVVLVGVVTTSALAVVAAIKAEWTPEVSFHR
jgi:hypothetical protein